MRSRTEVWEAVTLKMVASNRGQKRGLNTLMKKAEDLHGHLGPFLALGIWMGLIGIRETGAREGDPQLRVIVMLEYALPFSCILDGIQTATKCTVGNQRLTWRESKEIRAIFLLKSSERKVEVSVNPAVIQELSRRLDKNPSDNEVRQLASDIILRSEKELFLVRHK